jgi:hypothetical protein
MHEFAYEHERHLWEVFDQMAVNIVIDFLLNDRESMVQSINEWNIYFVWTISYITSINMIV